jgi:hypothetical protein
VATDEKNVGGEEASDEAFNNLGPVPGSRWRQKRSGRVVVIIESEVHGTGPSWRYEDEPTGPENWHYCDLSDFCLWGHYEFVSLPAKGRA